MIVLDFSTFLGRFHPLFVHLPIGFLLLALLLEWYESRKKAIKKSPLIGYAWFLGGISALVAAFCGWLLGESGAYPEDNLFVHRWLGIALVIVAFVGWWIKHRSDQYSKIVHNTVNFVLLAMLLIEGHKGGNLTHGDNYLVEYAPPSIQKILGVIENTNTLPQLSSPDSVYIYKDMVHPILESKCFACHNNEVQRGGLNMTTVELLQEGGENGPILMTGQPIESELFKRVTLPQKSVKFMPPKGEPITYDEIKVMEWWIAQGADFTKKVRDVEISDQIKPVFLRLYGLDTDPKPWYETVELAPADSTLLQSLQTYGFRVKSLGGENPLLDIKYTGTDLTKEQLLALEKVKDHITWLSLAESNVQDEWLSVVANFPNLTRLQLEKTSISDKGVSLLSSLTHLEVLNMYGTNVTDSCFSDIQKMETLKRIYLWETKVSTAQAKTLEDSNTTLEVIIGEG